MAFTKEIRIHRKYLPKLLERVIRDQINGALLLSFYQQMSCDGLSESRIVKVLTHLLVISELLGKCFRIAKKEDYLNLLSKIRTERTPKERTFEDYKSVLKKFLQWLGEDTSWIKVRNVENKILPEELLTEDEILRMVDAANNSRDKALVYVLWDSDCRIGELLGLRVKHLSFDEYGAVLMVNGKTGMRRVRIIESASILKQYLEKHPFKNYVESPLWVTDESEAMNYAIVWKMLKKLSKIAGIKKRIYPHLFRHSRSTYLAKRVSDNILAKHAGWRPGSRMIRKYVHLSGSDVDEALLSINKCNKTSSTAGSDGCRSVNGSDSKVCKYTACGGCDHIATVISKLDRIEQMLKNNSKFNTPNF